MPDASHARRELVLQALARYEGPLLSYAARLTGDADRARDVVQETFLRLCARDAGALEGRLGEWLYAVCRNLCLDVLKKERPMATASEDGVLERASAEPGPDAAAETSEGAARVLRALADLPANQREVLRLKFQHGLSYGEISGVTRLSVSNVGFLIHVGLKTLRQRLGDAAQAADARGGAR